MLDIISIMKENVLLAALPHLTMMDKNASLAKLDKSGTDQNVLPNLSIQLTL